MSKLSKAVKNAPAATNPVKSVKFWTTLGPLPPDYGALDGPADGRRYERARDRRRRDGAAGASPDEGKVNTLPCAKMTYSMTDFYARY